MMIRRIGWTVMCGLLALGGQAAAQELGDGRGIDHVCPMVRLENFDATASVWTDQLGFSLTPTLLSPLGPRTRRSITSALAARRCGSTTTPHALVSGNTGLTLPVFKDKGRDRFLIPASLTHGFLLEMVE
jgi:hypothetical protein